MKITELQKIISARKWCEYVTILEKNKKFEGGKNVRRKIKRGSN